MLCIKLFFTANIIQMVRCFSTASNALLYKLPRVYLAGSGISPPATVVPSPPHGYVDAVFGAKNTPMYPGKHISIQDANLSNYLCRVMRLEGGSEFRAFNEENGEFLCKVIQISKRKRSADGILVEVLKQLRSTTDDGVHSTSVMFAPIKKPRMKLLVEKATELGASSLLPVITQNTDKVCDVDGLSTTAIEAAEQCERLSIPRIHDVRTLNALLENMPAGITIVCVERCLGCSTRPLLHILDNLINNPDTARSQRLSVFVGPEGGFTAGEVEKLEACPSVRLVSLGRGVLRSETAALSALSAILNQREKYLSLDR